MKNLLTLLLLPIVFPIALVVWIYKAIFGSKTVKIGQDNRDNFLSNAEGLRQMAEQGDDEYVSKLLRESAGYLDEAAECQEVKRQALEDYERNVRMFTEMDLSGGFGGAKFVQMVNVIHDATGRLMPAAK